MTGLFVLVGWVLGIPWIKSVLPGAVEMKANTAVCLLVAGFALYLLDAPSSRRSKQLGQWLALFVAAIGFATVAEYVFGWNLGIDELLFKDNTDAYNPIRGRMSPYSAVVFAAIGLGLAALPVLWLRWLVWMSATLTILIGGVSFIGYLWNSNELVTDRYIPPVAVHTAAAFILLGLGTFMASRTSNNRIANRLTKLSRVEVKTLMGFLVTFLLLMLGGGMTYRAAVDTEKAARWIIHTQEVRSNLAKLYASLSDAESQHRNYLLIGTPDYLAEYKQFDGEVDQQEELLVRLIADNPAQTKRLKQLRTVVDARQDRLLRTVGVFEKSGLGAAQDIIRLGLAREQMKAIRSTIKQMDSAEAELLKVREAKTSQDKAKTLLSLLITLAIAAAGYIVLFSGIRREMATRAEAEEKIQVLNADLAQRADQIAAANKELEAFSYSVSHDLRAPIRHIEGYTELLGRQLGENPTEKALRYMKVIGDTTKEMGQLIDDLLSFSRMGRAEMQHQTVDLNQIAQATLAGLEAQTKNRNIVWKKAPLPTAQADPAMLRQVFANLLSNALKYSRLRDPAVIEWGVASETADEVVIFVRDNGAGFDMKYAHKLFGVFQRLHRSDEYEGTGIGLANVHRIVTRHGGRIWAEAAVDQGATFYFSLTKTINA